MKTLLITLSVMMIGSAGAQYEQKAVADAKKYNPSYSSFAYQGKIEKISGNRYYYRCQVDGYKNAGLSCYPNAKLEKGFWVEYWRGGGFKNQGTYVGSKYKGIPNPQPARLEQALAKSFKPVEFFDAAWLWDLLEIHDYEIEPTMTGQFEPIWTSEKEVMIHGYVTASIIRGCCDVEKFKFLGIFKFKSEDCGKSFTFVDGYQKPTMYNKESLGKTSYSQAEGLELQKKTIGRAHAENKAKEEWDNLAKLDIPNFDNPQEFALFVYRTMVTASEDEVKTMLYKTLPSYRFMEGSQYLLNWTAQETMAKNLDMILDNGGKNVRTNYCAVVNRYKNTATSYVFHDKAEESTLEIRVEKEGDQYKLKELKIWLEDGIADKTCPDPVKMTTVKNDQFGFSIDLPEGYKKTNTDKSVIYEIKVNGVKYMVAASHFGDGESNANRARISENNVNRHLNEIHSLKEEYSDWTMNGVTGKEVYFLANNKHYERYRTIYLGDYNYEFWILGLNFTENNAHFFESFKSEFGGGGSREGLSFAKGDPVEIHIGAGRYEKGHITKVHDDNKYSVFVTNQNKTYTAPIDAIRADKSGKPKVITSSDDNPTSYKAGDYVLYRTGQTTWEHAKVKAILEDGRYHVILYESGDQYYSKIKNLKPDPNPTEKTKDGGVKGKLKGLKGKL